jgi:hypothetical protein
MNNRARDAQLRAGLERRRAVNLRGTGKVKPLRLVYREFGDGHQLIAFHPPNTLPNYFVVRVDSSWQLSDSGQGVPLFCDHIGEIIKAIEAQFGPHWYVGDPVKRLDGGREFRPTKEEWGCHWFSLQWPPGLEPPAVTAIVAADGVESPAP